MVMDFSKTPWIWRVVSPPLRWWMKRRFTLRYNGPVPDPPFLLVANHTNILDPFFLTGFFPYPISWVASRASFRHPVVGWLLRQAHAISKQKNIPDLHAIRAVFRALKTGRVVGIFPEGSTTWDGNTGSFPAGTEKLLDKVSCDILAVRVNGAYLCHPRWAEKGRKGIVEIRTRLFKGREALDFLKTSDWEWQEERSNPYVGKDRALGIERLAWFCPSCGSYRGLHGEANQVRCNQCSFCAEVKLDGTLGGEPLDRFFQDQLARLKEYWKVHSSLPLENGRLFFRNRENYRVEKKVETKFSLCNGWFEAGSLSFGFEEMKGVNPYVENMVEFSTEQHVVHAYLPRDSLLFFSSYQVLTGGEHVLDKN
ncbi:MAG TPA: lysophospholipid acyltransferase family protein [Thermotogota bacterium]|nr:lysophospholipid acyltransferase family protein [Thermotogota bacterium]HRW92389.1 lysophospholipid acyltransferase family protein [Thermotogota bacterium]